MDKSRLKTSNESGGKQKRYSDNVGTLNELNADLYLTIRILTRFLALTALTH